MSLSIFLYCILVNFCFDSVILCYLTVLSFFPHIFFGFLILMTVLHERENNQALDKLSGNRITFSCIVEDGHVTLLNHKPLH